MLGHNKRQCCCLGAVHKGRPQRRGRGYGQVRTEGREVPPSAPPQGPCGRPQDGTFLELFQHVLQILPMGDGY